MKDLSLISEERAAHEDGYHAGTTNRPMEANPHEYTSELYMAWHHGWEEGQHDVDAEYDKWNQEVYA